MTQGTSDNGNDPRRRHLGEFLKARRAALSPDRSTRGASRRRTPGLRREEVAALADVGVTWYTWLEQGRDINVSAETLQRIARALQLSPSDTTYLFSLAGIHQIQTPLIPTEQESRLQAALDGYAIGPAFVVDRFMHVEAFNDLADGLFEFDARPGPFGRNHLWRMFMDPARRAIYPDWAAVAKLTVGAFRVQYAQHVEAPYVQSLLASLNEGSEEFRELWNQHHTVPLSPLPIHFKVPQHGDLHFTSLRFRFMAAEERYMVLLVPESPQTVAAMTDMASVRRSSGDRHY